MGRMGELWQIKQDLNPEDKEFCASLDTNDEIAFLSGKLNDNMDPRIKLIQEQYAWDKDRFKPKTGGLEDHLVLQIVREKEHVRILKNALGGVIQIMDNEVLPDMTDAQKLAAIRRICEVSLRD